MPDDLLSNLSPEAQQVLPKHVAIIMDGNGRWAKQRRLPRTVGHRRGLESLRTVVRTASRLGIKYLTLFTFSAENWNRPKSEVDTIMRYLGRFLRTEIPEFNSYNVQLDAIGQIERLPQKVQDQLTKTKETLSNNDGMTMVLALSYGARQEMIDAHNWGYERYRVGVVTEWEKCENPAYLWKVRLEDSENKLPLSVHPDLIESV